MRLTDLMSGANLDAYASVSLAIFLVVFAAVVARVILMPRAAARDASRMPLDDSPPRAKERRHG